MYQRRLQGDLAAAFQSLREFISRRKSNVLHGLMVAGQGGMALISKREDFS